MAGSDVEVVEPNVEDSRTRVARLHVERSTSHVAKASRFCDVETGRIIPQVVGAEVVGKVCGVREERRGASFGHGSKTVGQAGPACAESSLQYRNAFGQLNSKPSI